jgi:hypothetical protein
VRRCFDRLSHRQAAPRADMDSKGGVGVAAPSSLGSAAARVAVPDRMSTHFLSHFREAEKKLAYHRLSRQRSIPTSAEILFPRSPAMSLNRRSQRLPQGANWRRPAIFVGWQTRAWHSSAGNVVSRYLVDGKVAITVFIFRPCAQWPPLRELCCKFPRLGP